MTPARKPRSTRTSSFGALHPSSARTIHLPAFLADLLRQHQQRQHHEHVFTAADDTLLRRSNFRRRIWIPAVAGDTKRGWEPILPGLTFHGLRHTHRTWLTEDRVHEVLIFNRMGWHLDGVRGIYDHVTKIMIIHLLDQLQQRWNDNRSGNDHRLGRGQDQSSQNPPTNSRTPTSDDHQQGF